MSADRPVKRDDLELTEVEDGFVAYDQTTDRVHHMNVPLVAVFELATGDRTAAEIASSVAEQFDLEDPPLDDVASAIENLRREGLIS